MISEDAPRFLAYQLVLVAHIAAGFVGMYGGLVPLFTRKGGADHRRWGRVFTYAMGAAALTAFPLAVWRADPFQAAVGVYSGYLTLFGYRVLRRRPTGPAPAPPDAALAVAALAAFALLTVGGIWLLASGAPSAHPNGRTALLFGLLGLLVAGRDLHGLLTRDFSARRRVVDHLVASSLALVSGYSAFFNTQLHRLTGLHWPIDAKMLLSLALALPAIACTAVAWDRRLRSGRPAVNTGQTAPTEIDRLRAFGLAEGVSLLLLLFIAVPLKRLAGEAALVKIMGPLHGALFVLYVTSALLAARSQRWRWPRVLGALAAATLPLGTFLFDARLRRETARQGDTEA